MFLKKKIIKVQTLRSHIKKRLADALEKINESNTVDQIETELIALGIKYALEYYDVKNAPSGVNEVVAEEVVECLGKLNMRLQNRLRE